MRGGGVRGGRSSGSEDLIAIITQRRSGEKTTLPRSKEQETHLVTLSYLLVHSPGLSFC